MTWKLFQQPDERPSAAASPDPGTEGAPEAPAAPASSEEQLRSEIAALKAELEQAQDRFLRKAAEFENYRKRMEKERNDAALLARSSVLIEFLALADDCERALTSMESPSGSNDSIERFREGVRLLYKQVQDALQRVGAARIDALGKPFDPHLHEAVMREASAELSENTVLQELRAGYLLRDRLLRPAQVKVSMRPPGGEDTGT